MADGIAPTLNEESVLRSQHNVTSNVVVFESRQVQTDQNLERYAGSSSFSNYPKSKRRRNGPTKKEDSLPVSSTGTEVKNKGDGKKAKGECIGGRIIALKQLLSPYGKTDAASVLQETIEYIKYLHGQAQILCSSYLPDALRGEMESRIELKSRGLCLVPAPRAIEVVNSLGGVLWVPDSENNNGTG